MASRARSKGTNKKTRRLPKAGTTAVDRRLLAKAEREAAEGRVARKFTKGLVAALEKHAPTPTTPLLATPPAKPTEYRIPAREFDSVCSQLKELVHTFVEMWAERDDENTFDEALCRLHEARKNLESVAVAVEVQS